MVQKQSMLKVADNSGAKIVQVICLLGGTGKRFARLGDVVKVAVKKAIPNAAVKKGTVVDAVIVRCRKESRRANGTYVRFDDNAVVIIKENEPVGTRVFGPVAGELKSKNCFDKILSLAAQVV
jgi:large subunit ribosomal protein L14